MLYIVVSSICNIRQTWSMLLIWQLSLFVMHICSSEGVPDSATSAVWLERSQGKSRFDKSTARFCHNNCRTRRNWKKRWSKQCQPQTIILVNPLLTQSINGTRWQAVAPRKRKSIYWRIEGEQAVDPIGFQASEGPLRKKKEAKTHRNEGRRFECFSFLFHTYGGGLTL